MPVTPTLRRWQMEEQKFKVILDYQTNCDQSGLETPSQNQTELAN